MSLEQIGCTHYCPVCGEEDYPQFHVCKTKETPESELTRLRAENEELKEQLEITQRQREESVKAEASMRVLKTSQEAMVKGVWKQHEDQFAQLKAENEELRKALEPLSNILQLFSADTPDSACVYRAGYEESPVDVRITLADCRRAAELLNRKTPK